MNRLSSLLALAMTAAVLVGVQPPARAATAPDVYPSTAVLLAEINVDDQAGSARVGDSLVFTGVTNGDAEPWITDGAAKGTHRLRDIAPGSSAPRGYVSFRGRVFFIASTVANGTELWVTDGTAAGTRLAADVWPGNGSSDPRYLTVVGDSLFFRAQTAATGFELFVSDGTASGTRLHTDIRPGPASSGPAALTAFGDRVLLTAMAAHAVFKLYVAGRDPGAMTRLDSEPQDTSLLVDSIATLGDRAVLAIEELWDTRGIAGDARVLKDIEPGAALSTPRNLTELGGRALFVANTSASGFEPWVTDGTQDGTMLLGDLWPGTGGSRVQGIVVADDAAFFEADTGVVNGLWLTRGTPATTRQVPLPRGVTEVDQVVGAAADQVTVLARTADNLVVYATDGTPAGTRMLPELGPGPDGAVDGIGGLGATQIIEVVPDDGQPRLYAWTAARSTTKAKPKASYDAVVAKRKQVRVTVRVKASTGERLSGGLVTLTRKGRVVGRAQLVDGVAKVRIRVRLQPGKRHHLRASWTGTVDAATSTSPRFAVRIRPRR